MLDVVLYRPSHKARPRFYRVEIAMDLFSEVSVLREWGVKGGAPCETITSFGNLRDASHAAILTASVPKNAVINALEF